MKRELDETPGSASEPDPREGSDTLAGEALWPVARVGAAVPSALGVVRKRLKISGTTRFALEQEPGGGPIGGPGG